MITPTQMRAARAMLDVPQGYVAEHLGIAANTLSKIESGQSDVSISRMSEIQRFYEREGIAFTEEEGVKWNANPIIKYEGQAGIREFFDDVYKESLEGCEINLFNGVPSLLTKWLGTEFYKMHADRMSELKDKLSVKIIVEETETNFIAGSFAEYRGFPKSMFNNKTIYIYGRKVGFFTFSDENVSIRVFDNAELATSMKVLFGIAWDKVAKKISK
ncbi:MAG TPA: helix-turn-helix transcriptional regulator [Alphaproteobacteria bacterium]|nr:helix-turn-helix transcriptional regulator [Alphaproteobacteria bacterium]